MSAAFGSRYDPLVQAVLSLFALSRPRHLNIELAETIFILLHNIAEQQRQALGRVGAQNNRIGQLLLGNPVHAIAVGLLGCANWQIGHSLTPIFTVQLSLARRYSKVLKVSDTIPDLAGSENFDASHIAKAIQCRSLDRRM